MLVKFSDRWSILRLPFNGGGAGGAAPTVGRDSRENQLPWAICGAILFLLLCACEGKSNGRGEVVGEPAMAGYMHFEYAVYLPPAKSKGAVDPLTVLADSLGHYPSLKLVSELPKEARTMQVQAHLNGNIRQGYVPPDLERLRYSGNGLSREQAVALQKWTRALILDFAHSRKDAWTGLKDADRLVSEVARRMDGLVWDEETREVFTADAWDKRRLADWTRAVPRVSSQDVVQTYNTGQSVRAITLGMAKMGLPDLVVEDSGWSSYQQIGNLINLVSQAMAEGELLPKSRQFRLVLRQIRDDGLREEMSKSLKAKGTGIGCLTLAPGQWEEGDPHNRLIQLTFDRYPGSDSYAKQDRMLSSFFGSEDSVHYIKHDEELLSASAKAKEQLPALQKAFAAGLAPGEYLEVKVPFKTDSGGNEWMWVEVRTWNGDCIRGLLDNEPARVAGLHSGQEVEVRQQDVFDYIHTFADKRKEGNTTGEIIQEMERETVSKAETPHMSPVLPDCDEK